MQIVVCPRCRIGVAVTEDGNCPSCRKPLNGFGSESRPSSDAQADKGERNDLEVSQEGALRNSPIEATKLEKTKCKLDQSGFRVGRIFFSPHGRVSLSVFWFVSICDVLVLYLGTVLLTGLLGKESSLLSTTLLTLWAATFWSLFSICVKRLHDLGMSGWWVLALLIPGIGQYLHLFLLAGTSGLRGPNRFGAEPVKLYGN